MRKALFETIRSCDGACGSAAAAAAAASAAAPTEAGGVSDDVMFERYFDTERGEFVTGLPRDEQRRRCYTRNTCAGDGARR